MGGSCEHGNETLASINTENLLNGSATLSFSTRTLLHAVGISITFVQENCIKFGASQLSYMQNYKNQCAPACPGTMIMITELRLRGATTNSRPYFWLLWSALRTAYKEFTPTWATSTNTENSLFHDIHKHKNLPNINNNKTLCHKCWNIILIN
jgi:hypothetical protein